MNAITTFSGFPQEGHEFLDALAQNNNRAWFEAHKQEYDTYILAPAQAFTVALGEKLKTLSTTIIYDTQTNGSGSIMRIYRDTRFIPDKIPYKTNLGIFFWEGTRKKLENPGFMFHMEAHHARVFAGLHTFSQSILTTYRDAVVNNMLGTALTTTIAAIHEADGYEIGGTHYKRVPRGYDREHKRSDLLKYNGLYAIAPQIDSTTLSTPELVDVCFEQCQTMLPLHQWLVQIHSQMG